jgi:hypothetical protein
MQHILHIQMKRKGACWLIHTNCYSSREIKLQESILFLLHLPAELSDNFLTSASWTCLVQGPWYSNIAMYMITCPFTIFLRGLKAI